MAISIPERGLIILSYLSQLNEDGTPIVESEIISWANARLQEGGKDVSIKHFQDKVSVSVLISGV